MKTGLGQGTRRITLIKDCLFISVNAFTQLPDSHLKQDFCSALILCDTVVLG